jgi:sialic acid synthase SpsE
MTKFMQYHSPELPDFSPRVLIGDQPVGRNEKCFIIAEAGSNHDKNLEKALRLVDAAADAGCDAVKFQTFSGTDIAAGGNGDHVMLPDEFSRWGSTLQELYANCALPTEFHKPLFDRSQERGIQFISSPFCEQSVDLLVELGTTAIKIASFELVHLPLIRHAANSGLPLIISTGMAGMGDIERALEAVSLGGGTDVILLHCGSNYPLGAASAHLAAMETLRMNFGIPVGYSDHTLGLSVPIAAAALGANAFEKHFTLEERGKGPDHDFALTEKELANMVSQMREAALAVGKPHKRRQPEEAVHSRRGRRSLFAAQKIKAGDPITSDMIKVVRPGNGLEPIFLDLVLSCRAVVDIESETPLTWDHFVSMQKD